MKSVQEPGTSPSIPRRRFHRAAFLAASVAAFLVAIDNGAAIDWCHDYTASTITDSDHSGLGPGQLRDALKDGGYQGFNVGNMSTKDVDKRLQPGDVIIFGDAHSGVVNADGKITHYIQQRDSKNRTVIVAVSPKDVRNQPTYGVNTFEELRNFTREGAEGGTVQPYNNSSIQLWRPTLARDIARDRVRASIRTAIQNAARSTARTAAKPPVKPMHPPSSRRK